MFTMPRYDLLRTEVDHIHAQCFNKSDDFYKSHKVFVNAVQKSFSPLTECAAIEYAQSAYHSDITDLEQYFNVVRNNWDYDIQLVIANKNDKYPKKLIFQHSYKCLEKAMETCRIINKLFGFYEELNIN